MAALLGEENAFEYMNDARFICRGQCGGLLMVEGSVCTRCGRDNSTDRQVRESTLDSVAQSEAHQKGHLLLAGVDGLDDLTSSDDDDEEDKDAEVVSDEDDDDDDDGGSAVGDLARVSPAHKSRGAGIRKDQLVNRANQAKLAGPDAKKGRYGGADADLIPYAINSNSKQRVAKLLLKFSNLADPNETKPAAVRAHCSILLMKWGYRFGDSDGPAAIYARVVERMMKIEGGFKIKPNFTSENCATAQELAEKMASIDKQGGKNPKTSKEKLEGNYMAAFNKYCEARVKEAAGEIDLSP